MKHEIISLTACRMVLGLARAEELVSAAAQALEEGDDSSSLRSLAGLTTTETARAGELFDAALAELSLPRPSKRDLR